MINELKTALNHSHFSHQFSRSGFQDEDVINVHTYYTTKTGSLNVYVSVYCVHTACRVIVPVSEINVLYDSKPIGSGATFHNGFAKELTYIFVEADFLRDKMFSVTPRQIIDVSERNCGTFF